jgi:hypothetical protein
MHANARESPGKSGHWIDLSRIEGAFKVDRGLRHPQWESIGKAIETSVPEGSRIDAWGEAARQWVDELQADLGGQYSVCEGKNVILLSPLAPKAARRFSKFSASVYEDIVFNLKHLAWEGWPGVRVVLIFTEADDYEAYLGAFFTGGQVPRVSGVHLNQGYPHVALLWTTEEDVCAIIVHELGHHCLAHLPLPIWLNEGIAVVLEHLIIWARHHLLASWLVNRARPQPWAELAPEHRQHWNARTIQTFWAGTSFHEGGIISDLSYSLAAALTVRLDKRRLLFLPFVRHAGWEDAGQTAAMEWLGIELGQEVAALLGPGDWDPSSEAIRELSVRSQPVE